MKAFGYSFKDLRVLRQALAPKVGVAQGTTGLASEFERLEFLGDAALQLLVSQYLVNTFPGSDEGELSELRIALVCNRYLAKKLVRRFSSELEAGLPHGFFPLAMQGAVGAFAERLLQEQPSPEADFVVGQGFAACALASTATRAMEVAEGPKCVADLYEAMVAAMLIDTAGDLARVWDAIKTDFQVAPEKARHSLMQWHEFLRERARSALRRAPAVTVRPEPSKAEEVRRTWPARLEVQRRALERRTTPGAQAGGSGSAAQPWPPAGADTGADRRPPSAGGQRSVGTSMQEDSQHSAAVGPLEDLPSVPAGGEATPAPVRARAAPAAAPAAKPGPHDNARNQLQELLSRYWHRQLTPEELCFDLQPGSGVNGMYFSTVRIKLPADAGHLDFEGSGHTRTAAQIAAAHEALASEQVQMAFTEVRHGNFEHVLREVLRQAGPAGRTLVALGNTPQVIRARTEFRVPNKRKLRDIVAACSDFELSGQGLDIVVRLRTPAA